MCTVVSSYHLANCSASIPQQSLVLLCEGNAKGLEAFTLEVTRKFRWELLYGMWVYQENT